MALRSRRRRNQIAWALWANAGLLLVLVVVLISRQGPAGWTSGFPTVLPAAYAQAQGPIAGGAGVFIVPGQFSTNTWGCYLLDIDAQTLVAYQFVPADKNLRLVAARGFRDDRRLRRFNTSPDPNEVANLVRLEQDNARVVEQNKPLPDAEAAPKSE